MGVRAGGVGCGGARDGEQAQSPNTVGEPLRRGSRVGRYLLLDAPGAIEETAVLRGYDPVLDRRVAIKFAAGAMSASTQERIRDEARAMAQLAHGNLVQVYDVGLCERRLFFAMQWIDGLSLEQWLRERPRRWREIRSALVGAGRGLAAAHAAGLVHGALEPSSILIDRAGVARIANFGVARTRAEAARATEFSAPELAAGGGDSRSDQYSFSAIAHAALFGDSAAARPGTSTPVRSAPRWLRRVAERGRSAAPGDRYPSMEALLADLSRERTGRRTAGLIAGLAAAGAAAAIAMPEPSRALCASAGRPIDEVWTPARREAMRAAFAKSTREYAAATLERVDSALDARASAWRAMRVQACRATRVTHSQSDRVLDLRMQCLDRSRDEFRALVELLTEQLTDDVLQNAVDAARGLRPLGACADVEALLAAIPAPADPAVRAQVAELRRSIDRARVMQTAGDYRGALRAAQEAADATVEVAYAPVRAEALHQLGVIQRHDGAPREAEISLRTAAALAASVGNDDLMAQASSALLYVIGFQQRRVREALALAPLAEADALRTGDGALQADADQGVGVLFALQNRFDDARPRLQRALELRRAALGDDHPNVASLLSNLARITGEQGRLDEARAIYAEVAERHRKTLGEQHPMVARAYNSLGGIAVRTHNLREAADYFSRALAIQEQAMDELHPDIANSVNNLGVVYFEQGNFREAARYLERALSIRERRLGSDHPEVASSLHNLGVVYGKFGNYAAALPAHRRALDILETRLGPDHPELGFALLGLGECLVDMGRAAEALAPLERAVRLRSRPDGNPFKLAEARFSLARAQRAAGRPARQWRPLAERARATYASGGPERDARRAEVDAWLANPE